MGPDRRQEKTAGPTFQVTSVLEFSFVSVHVLTLWIHFTPKATFMFQFHKICPTHSQVRRIDTAKIRSSLESSDPGAFSDVGNVSKITSSAPNASGWISKFDPPFDTPGLKLSSAL